MFLFPRRCIQAFLVVLASTFAAAQQGSLSGSPPLDAAGSLSPVPSSSLPEEYIWTAGDVTALRPDHASFPWSRQELRTEPHLFRAHFSVPQIPSEATLYVAGPRDAEVFVNGRRLAHFSSNIDAPIGIHVFHADARGLLVAGENTVAIRAIRGRGIVSADASAATSQLTYGEVLAVKLLAAAPDQKGASLLVSNGYWRSGTTADAGAEGSTAWTAPGFHDSEWPRVGSLGPIESSREFRQWSADAGMYAWPGYQGISSRLRTYLVPAVAVTHIFSGQATLTHADALTATARTTPFTIQIPTEATAPTDAAAPSLLLDFGREIAGRLLIASASKTDALVSIAYGESELEALATGLTPGQRGGNYLGTNLLEVPKGGVARGPKSAFRYVRLRFLRGGPRMVFPRIQAEGITYPVTYGGSFQSSDALLNRIWETGAYTVHLCMQDDLWDAPKRDRGRWAGDIDVEGRVISEVFGDKDLVEQTLAALATDVPASGVNGIPNYSALWITSLERLYATSGDLAFVRTQHEALLRVLATMDRSLDPTGAFTNRANRWLFVDWSPGLYGTTPAAVLGTNFQYVRGYRAAASLLQVLGDAAAAEHARAAAARLTAALSGSSTKGISPDHDWQLSALAVQLGLVHTPDAREAMWSRTFAHVKQDSPEDPVISPYFNLSVLDAMASLGHGHEALNWLRSYWGGMLSEGATSFWEAYDLRWPKDTPHLSLQADGTTGFFVSLAHGWSAGPTAWLMENVLGVGDPAEGYRRVTIAPRLLGLDWAKGTVPTPHGPIAVSLRHEADHLRLDLDLPSGIEDVNVSLQPIRSGTSVMLDGKAISLSPESVLPKLRSGKHSVSYTPAGP